MNILWKFYVTFMTILWKFYENFMKLLWKFNGNFMKILCNFYENFMQLLWKFYENFTQLLWKFYETFMKILCNFYENFMKILTLGTEFFLADGQTDGHDEAPTHCYVICCKKHDADSATTYQSGEFLAHFGAPLLVGSAAGRHFDEEVTQFPAQWWVPVQFYARYP